MSPRRPVKRGSFGTATDRSDRVTRFAWDQLKVRGEEATTRRRSIVVGLITAIVLIVAVISTVVLLTDDNDDDVSTAPRITDAEAASVVWPDPAGTISYDEPRRPAQRFAKDMVGFTDPLMGEFQRGDSRSGEFEVQPRGGGPTTTVLVRQMSDEQWYVIGATTDDILVDDPIAGTAIDDPLLVSGKARAFEGTVRSGRLQTRPDRTPRQGISSPGAADPASDPSPVRSGGTTRAAAGVSSS